METLKQQDLRDVVRGACFLASGGGGGYDTGMQIANKFADTEPVTICSIEEIVKQPRTSNKTCYGVVTAVMGAPEKMKELEDGMLNVAAVKKLAHASGIVECQIKCIVPVEIGALSSIIACVTASAMNIPVIDADGAGRAVPKLNMTTFSVNYQLASVNPTILLAQNGQYVSLEVTEGAFAASTIESLARPVLDMPQFNGMAAIALWLIDLDNLEQVCPIQGTLTKCLNLGKTLRTELEEKETHDFDKILNTLKILGYSPKLTLECTLKGASTVTKGGFDNGIIELEIIEPKESLKIIFQNESLLLWSNKLAAPRVLAPDLISYLIPPTTPTCKQWLYSNADIMENGKLKKDFENKEIILICMEAPRELKNHHENLFNLQGRTSGSGVNLQDSYTSMLEELNYYGRGDSCF